MNLFHNFTLRLRERLSLFEIFLIPGDLDPLSSGWASSGSGGGGVPLYLRGATSLEAEQEDEKLNKAIALLQGEIYNQIFSTQI